MKRLTRWIDDGEERQAIPEPAIRKNGHRKCCNKLAEYEDAEEQGLLLRVPCKVGERWRMKRKKQCLPTVICAGTLGSRSV